MAFNLDDYETVAERLDRAIKDHPDMRIITDLVHVQRDKDGRPMQYIVKAEIWLGTTLVSTGYAEEIVGSSHINKTSALENAESSAVGRGLSNFSYQGSNPKSTRPSRNEMEKVERVRRAEQEQVKQAKPLDWGEPTPPEPVDDVFGSWDPVTALGAEVIETKPKGGSSIPAGEPSTEKQQKLIRAKYAELHPDGDLAAFVAEVIRSRDIDHLTDLTKWEASQVIDKLLKG
jgi:hypothetical protein